MWCTHATTFGQVLLRKVGACCLTVALPALLREATAPDGAIVLARLPLGPSHAAQLHRHLCASLQRTPRLELRGAAALGGAGTRALFWAEAGAEAGAEDDPLANLAFARAPTSAPMRAPRLRHLTLAGCGLDSQAAALLAAALCAGAMPQLRALYLSGNRLAHAAPAEQWSSKQAGADGLRNAPPPPLPPPPPPPSGLELLGEAIGKRPMLRRLDLS